MKTMTFEVQMDYDPTETNLRMTPEEVRVMHQAELIKRVKPDGGANSARKVRVSFIKET